MRFRWGNPISLVVLLAGSSLSSALVASFDKPQPNPAAPLELVRAAVARETAAADDSSVKHMFRDCKKTPQGSQTRIYVETRQAMAGMTIAYNDKPLSNQQMQDEENHLAGLIANPDELQRKQQHEKESADRTLRIVKALPVAFLFDYDGKETGTANLGADGMPLVRLKFRPNPEYRPPSHVEDVLVGMAGVLLIDPSSRRIARIDGTLFKEVSFGWGILGHLNKGGHFLVEQQNLEDGSWDISHMRLDFTGKILMFKSLAIHSDEAFTNFRRVPADTSFAEGVKMLKAEHSRLVDNSAQTTKAEGKSR